MPDTDGAVRKHCELLVRPPELEAVDRAFAPFGLTETYAPCSLIGYKPGGNAFAGLMMDGNEGRIIDPETGQEQPRGIPGEQGQA